MVINLCRFDTSRFVALLTQAVTDYNLRAFPPRETPQVVYRDPFSKLVLVGVQHVVGL